ncbi:hypothetical protein ACLB2K_016237 [Fragaria x ananassa]
MANILSTLSRHCCSVPPVCGGTTPLCSSTEDGFEGFARVRVLHSVSVETKPIPRSNLHQQSIHSINISRQLLHNSTNAWKGVVRFGKRGKLSPRYIGPYEIIERVGSLAYRLVLPSELSRIHNVFHVSMLRKYIADPSHVLEEQPISLQKDLSYEEEPVQILDRKEQVLRSKSIPLVKVLWRSHQVEEATWESEEQMRQQYPYLFE